MINKFLHSLTNRRIISDDPMFASDPTFVPANLSADDLKLRSILCLDYTTSDYYLKNYVALADIYPDILSVLNDTVTSYQTKDFLPRGVRMQGATLLSNPGVSGFYSDLRPLSLPIGLSYSIDFVAPVVCQINRDRNNATSRLYFIIGSERHSFTDRLAGRRTISRTAASDAAVGEWSTRIHTDRTQSFSVRRRSE
jgi:hypothetical protein